VGISTERALLPTSLLVSDRSKIVAMFIIVANELWENTVSRIALPAIE
jgi:hypothetical protein